MDEKMPGLVAGLTLDQRIERAKIACLMFRKQHCSDQAADGFEELRRLDGRTDTADLAVVREYRLRRPGSSGTP